MLYHGYSTPKNNGESRLVKTINQYLYYIKPYYNDLESIKDSNDLILFMNQKINQRQAGILHAVFIIYLEFRGYDIIDDKFIFDKLRKPKKRATAFSSKRTMQSKTYTIEEFKKLLNEAETVELKCALAMSFDLGCRISELTGIHYKDIKFTKNEEDKKAGIMGLVTLHGKGGKSRVGYIHKTTYSLLYKLNGGKYCLEDKVFIFYDFGMFLLVFKPSDYYS